MPPDLLLHLRAALPDLTPRDINDITHRLETPAALQGAFPDPSGIPPRQPQAQPDQTDPTPTPMLTPAQVELEIALLCLSRFGHAQALRSVMLRHLGRATPAADAALEQAWAAFVALRGPGGDVDRLSGHNVSEIVTIYMAMLARRAVEEARAALGPPGEGMEVEQGLEQRQLAPPHVHTPYFAAALSLGLRVGSTRDHGHGHLRSGKPLSPSLAAGLLQAYVTPDVLGALQGWLAAVELARMVHDGRKLFFYVRLLARNRRVDEVWELWRRCEEAVASGWATFAGGMGVWEERGLGLEEGEGVGEGREVEAEEDYGREETDEPERAEQQQQQQQDGNPGPPLLPVQITTPLQTVFLSSFLLLHRPDLTTAVLTTLLASGVTLTTHHYSALLSGFAKRGSWTEAQQAWDMMAAQGVARDRASWNSWLQALFGGKKWREGMREFGRMREAFPERGAAESGRGGGQRAVPAKEKEKQAAASKDKEDKEEQEQGVGIQVWNTVLHGLFQNDRVEEARMLWREMLRLDIVDIVSYNTVLKFQARAADWPGIARVLRSLKDAGVRPDQYTFTTILEAVAVRPKGGDGARRGEEREVQNMRKGIHLVWDVMRRQGIRANGVMVGKVIDAMVSGGREENVRAAVALLEEIDESEPGDGDWAAHDVRAAAHAPEGRQVGPAALTTGAGTQDLPVDGTEHPTRLNEITYTACIAGIIRSPALDMPVKRALASSLLARMRARNIGANRVTYHVLIRACFDGGAPAEAMALWREARESGVGTRDTWQIVVKGLCTVPPAFSSVPSAPNPFTPNFLFDRPRTAPQPGPAVATMSPTGQLVVQDGTREEWIMEVSEALQQDGVAMDGSLGYRWNRLINSRDDFGRMVDAFG